MLDTVLDTGELNVHSPDWRNVFTGLLGGYQVYEHVACSRLLSLEKAVVRTQALREMAGTTHGSFASTCRLRQFRPVFLRRPPVWVAFV